MVDDAPPPTSDYTGEQIYYRSIPRRREDHLTIHDYLWRWDTDWFWCSKSFGVQRPRIRRLWPKRYLRSDVYWKIIAFERRHAITGRVDRLRGQPGHEDVIQDIEVPIDRAAEFLDVLPPRDRDRPGLDVPAAASRRGRRRGPSTPLRAGDHLRELRLLGTRRSGARASATATATA